MDEEYKYLGASSPCLFHVLKSFVVQFPTVLWHLYRNVFPKELISSTNIYIMFIN